MSKLDLNTLKRLVEHKYSLINALHEYNPEGKYDFTHNVFCPFHANENTPSAKLYKGVGNQTDSLYCFTEKRTYKVSDVVSKLMGQNIYEVGYMLWNEMSELEREEFLNSIGKVDYKKMFSGTQQNQTNNAQLNNKIVMYRENRTTITELLQLLVENKAR